MKKTYNRIIFTKNPSKIEKIIGTYDIKNYK